MSEAETDIFSPTIQKTHSWLKDVMGELDWQDRHKAYLALRAVLQALRDRLTVEEAVQFGAQLPMLIRGFYYEGWDPTGKPLKERHREQFLAHVKHYFKNDDRVEPEKVTRAVFAVLSQRVTAGEVEDVKQILPKELRELWN